MPSVRCREVREFTFKKKRGVKVPREVGFCIAIYLPNINEPASLFFEARGAWQRWNNDAPDARPPTTGLLLAALELTTVAFRTVRRDPAPPAPLFDDNDDEDKLLRRPLKALLATTPGMRRGGG